MNYKDIERYEWTLNTSCQVKEVYILYNFMYMTLWKSQNYKDNKQTRGCQEELGGGSLNWGEEIQGIFFVVQWNYSV